jgi:hypothetical protein
MIDESRFGCTMSCDEFVRFWQNKGLRNYICQKAWLWAKSKEDYQDLRQEAWAAICLLPPDSPMVMAERSAYNAMQNIYKKNTRREKKFSKTSIEMY